MLVSGFVDENNIIPVKLEVKEFWDKENTLHVAIALESINMDEIVKQEVATGGVARQYSPSSNISIAKIFEKINPTDKSFLKYIPDGFLNDKQKQAKQEALREDGTVNEILGVRYSLADRASREVLTEAFYGMAQTDAEREIVVRRGQYNAMMANIKHDKVYRKQDAAALAL